MKIRILTLFPDFFKDPLGSSMLKQASSKNLVSYEVVDIRDHTIDRHRTTDDRPYGGGPGMVMMVEPIDRALSSLPALDNHRVVLTSAKGEIFTQQKATDYAQLDGLTIICGHYAGVDERVARHLVDDEVRIGDYVLTGGEPAALVITDSVTRLIPGVLGNESSCLDESHSNPGKLGFPQYTRPADYKGWQVPSVLLEGDHQAISKWRKHQQQDPRPR